MTAVLLLSNLGAVLAELPVANIQEVSDSSLGH